MEKRGYTLAELAEKTSSQLEGDPTRVITGVNSLEEATSEDASFLANDRYRDKVKSSLAGVICIDGETPRSEGKNYLISRFPSQCFQRIVSLLIPVSPSAFSGIHPTAVIHETAKISPEVVIAPYAVIDRDTRIGRGTVVGPHVAIGPGVEVGENCLFHAHVVIREGSRVGNRVTLQPGAVIGSCGFGYLLDAKGAYQKLEQLGIVILEDDVEIGANTCIDRARFKTTRVRRGSKIDNLCQIAHNVEIGEDNAIAAQTGIAGSSATGRHVVLGGQVGIVGHVELGNQVMVASRGGISKSLPKAGKYRGSPAIPMEQYHRQEVHLRRLEEYVKRLKALEEKVDKLAPGS